MLTSSISDEALQICSSKRNDKHVDTQKPGIHGAFEHLVSSQREVHFSHEERGRGGVRENYKEYTGRYSYETEKWAAEYDRAIKNSLENPEEFWAEIGHELTWFKPWDKVMDNTNPPFTKWFVGGMLNACYNAVDRHVENGYGDRVALIHDSPVTSTVHHITYSQLLDKVSRLAGVYASVGVKKGDRVLIYMPMIPEAIISMLATARIGAIHSVVFGGFAARELKTRIEHAEPTVIVAASCGLEPNKVIKYRCILQEALLHSKHKPTHVIMYERPEIPLAHDINESIDFEDIKELDWEQSLLNASHHDCVPVEANDPLYILYTSGTTDQPKGVVRPVGGHLATLCWTMHAVYGMKPPKKSHVDINNGEISGSNHLINTSREFEHFHVTKEEPISNSMKELINSTVITTSISESNIDNEISVENSWEVSNLNNSDSCKIDIEQDISTKCTDEHLEPFKSGDEKQFLSKVKLDCDHKIVNQDSMMNIPSKPSSNDILSKVCLKMRQIITGIKDKISIESVGHGHINESSNEVKSSGNSSNENQSCNNQSSKIWETGYKNIEDGQLPKGEHEIANLSLKIGLNAKDNGCIFDGPNNEVTKFVKIPTQKSDCILTTSETKSVHFSHSKSRTDQDEIFQSHDECMYTQFPKKYSNHLQIGRRKSDLNIKLEKKCEINGNIKFTNPYSTFGKSHQLSRSKSKIKSLNDESQYDQTKVWWAASDMGWVVGHSYVCYAPLTAGITSVMYEGKPDRTPDPGQYFRVIQQHGVNAILTAPTALRVIKRVDPHAVYGKQFSTDSLETIFVAGENLDQSTKTWAEKTFKVDVVNHWWQTETGHSITATCIGLGHSSKNPPGLSTGKPFPGFNLHILREDGSEAAIGEEGRIAARLPLPPGTLSTLYKNPEMFKSLYFSTFPGYYDTMDAGYIVSDRNSSSGWIVVTGREDDVVSVAGHRLSASALEAVALQHPDVSDALVVGTPDQTKGEVPLCLYVPTKDWKKDAEEEIEAAQRISNELICMVRELVGPIAAFRLASPVPALPKTRSGKIPRKSVARMARGLPLKIPSTIEDPSVYEDIKTVLQKLSLYE